MAFRVNGASPMVKAEVTAGLSAIGASAFGQKIIAVSGVTGDMCIDAVFASAHSAGFYIEQCQVLSANNIQLDIFNATNGSITHGSTLFRFVSK